MGASADVQRAQILVSFSHASPAALSPSVIGRVPLNPSGKESVYVYTPQRVPEVYYRSGRRRLAARGTRAVGTAPQQRGQYMGEYRPSGSVSRDVSAAPRRV